MSKLRLYNNLIRRIARNHSARYGLDTPKSRTSESRMLRDLRRTYPFSQYGITWS